MPKRKRSSSTKKKKSSTRYRKKTRYNNTMPRLKPELKAVDMALTSNLGSGGSFRFCNGIEEGTGRYQRIGKQVYLKTLEYSLYITPQSPPVITNNWHTDIPRIMIVLDKKPTGTMPIISDVLQVQDNNGLTSTNPQSFTNLNNQKRFKILMSWEPVLPSFTHAATTGIVTNIGPCVDPISTTFSKHGYIKLKRLQSFLSATNSLAAVEGNAIYIMWDSFYPAAACPWFIRTETRLRFLDP